MKHNKKQKYSFWGMRILAVILSFILTVPAIPGLTVQAEGTFVAYEVTMNQSRARTMLDLVNDFRTGSEAWYWNEDNTAQVKCENLSKLKYDYNLEKVAMLRCAELVKIYSHTRPNGTEPWTAYDECGYSYGMLGENIASGYYSVEAAFLAWREDNKSYSGQGHRRNMLDSYYNAFAVAFVEYNGAYFWAQEFARIEDTEADYYGSQYDHENPLDQKIKVNICTSGTGKGFDYVAVEEETPTPAPSGSPSSEAMQSPTPAPLQSPSSEPIQTPTPVSSENHGLSNPRKDTNGNTIWDSVWFGNYWQNDTNGDGKADKNDEKEPIKWRVLSIDGNKALLLSDKNLDSVAYNPGGAIVTWETCALRSWLNGYGAESNIYETDYTNDSFLGAVFTTAEKNAIAVTTLVNADNALYYTEGGNDTTDRIFLLAIDDVVNTAYGFDSDRTNPDKARRAANTAFAKEQGVNTRLYEGNYTGLWGLRSPGSFYTFSTYVDADGYSYGSTLFNDYTIGTRPALYLNLSYDTVWSKAGTVNADGTMDEIAPGEDSDNLQPTASPSAEPSSSPSVPGSKPQADVTVSITQKELETKDPAELNKTVAAAVSKTVDTAVSEGIIYNGSKQTVDLSLTIGNVQLAEGTDYSVKYKNAINAGTAQMDIKFLGDYKNLGTVSKTFTINSRSITDDEVAAANLYYEYKGKAIKPVPVLYYNGKKLRAGKDFEYDKTSIIANKTLVIKGKGNFTGSRSIKATLIDKTKETRTALSKAKVTVNKKLVYTGTAVEPAGADFVVTIGSGKNKTELRQGVDYTVEFSSNNKPGTAAAVIRCLDSSKNCYGEKIATFKIAGTKLTKAEVTLKIGNTVVGTKKGMEATYTGKVITPIVTVKITNANGKLVELKEGTDYTISYKKNRKQGTASVVITGIGAYTGTKTAKFKIK